MSKLTDVDLLIAALVCAVWLVAFVGGVSFGEQIGLLIFG